MSKSLTIPYILNYAEKIESDMNIQFEKLVYSEESNLTVVKETNEPAILYGLLDTETISKTDYEVSDTDRQNHPVLETMTKTDTMQEVSDSDRDWESALKPMLGTSTFTEVANELTDSD